MTEKRFEPDCNDYDNQYDYSLLNSRYEADVERNEIIEWNKDACNAQYTDLEGIAERLNFKQMQLEECHKGYEKLYGENEQLKEALFFYMSVAITETSSHINEDLEKECNQLLKCSYKEALEKYDTSKYEGV